MRLKEELGLKRDFDVPSHEAVLSIYYTAIRLRKSAQAFFRKAGVTDVQFNLLMLLYYQGEDGLGLTQSELSRMLLVNRANVTTLVDRMERAGLVKRSPSRLDRRANLVGLTGKGRAILLEVEAGYRDLIEEVMGALGEDETARLIGSLEKIRAKLSGGRKAARQP